MSSRTSIAFATVLILLPAAIRAEPPNQLVPAEQPATAAASDEEITQLIVQLDSDQYAERQAAGTRLAAIGRPAIAALTKAADADSLEVVVRSIELLTDLLQSDDEPTRNEAKAALEKVAKYDRPAAARRAQDAIEEYEKQQQAAKIVRGGGNAIQINLGRGAKRISVKTVNGVKEIDVDEGERQIKISEEPKKSIKVEITTTEKGKKSTEKFEAKDAEELKKKHPKAYEVYKQYGNQGGGIMVQGAVIQANIAAAARVRQKPDQLTTATRLLEAWKSFLDRTTNDDEVKKASKESRDALRTKVTETKKALDDLIARLDKADKEEKAKKQAELKAEAEEGESADADSKQQAEATPAPAAP